MWKVLIVALLCYGFFLYWQPSQEPIVLEDHEGWMQKDTPDSILLYINEHRNLAIQEMQRAKIPASITLGQAILESRFGTSHLAMHANNHFGIKASLDWDGKDRHCAYTYEWNQQKKGMYPAFACFRSYSDVEQCYIDHSEFLSTRPWYNALFQLDSTDWKAWAKGLQKAGYATDPNYATKLISLIERYQLQQIDQVTSRSTAVTLQKHSNRAY